MALRNHLNGSALKLTGASALEVFAKHLPNVEEQNRILEGCLTILDGKTMAELGVSGSPPTLKRGKNEQVNFV